ncbi:MAG: hypothetical protein EOM80_07070 [Erysipelotrichia bacterium]|nr:hypothetical protein [Erysipelotrichia bacterium]
MSGFIFCTDSKQLRADGEIVRPAMGISIVSRVALLAAFFTAMSTMPVRAGAFEWLNSGQRSSKANVEKTEQVESVQVKVADFEEQKLTGNDLDSYKFASSHWTHSRNRLEKACRAISSSHNDEAARDILQKLFVIDTQLFKESIKNSAMAVNEIKAANAATARGLQDLGRIITAPGQATLENLDKSVDQISGANARQVLLVKKYLVGAERNIQISQSAYETLELIPSLALNGLDMLVQMSKQLMRMTQSNAEAFKGLLLNVQSSSEQVAMGLETIKKTVRDTLRFSDHFAIRQFPLINLPAPSREKMFVQLEALNNYVKGVDNTVVIGDSQVRNTAQQFTHLTGGFIAKAAESMKYQTPDNSEKALEQISTYARNQISGLFLRVKEDISQTRNEMVRASRPVTGNMPPAVNFESRDEYASRKARSASTQKLPLFLLGGDGASKQQTNNSADSVVTQMASLDADFNNKPQNLKMPSVESFENKPADGFTRILYDEKTFSALPTSSDISDEGSDLMKSEVNILSQELGSDFFFGSQSENLSEGSLMAEGADIANSGEDDESDNDSGASADMQVSYDNLDDSGEPEIELMKFDAVSAGNDSDELMPMMRFDSDVLMMEE